jgi:hypothetical protein
MMKNQYTTWLGNVIREVGRLGRALDLISQEENSGTKIECEGGAGSAQVTG